MGKIGRLKANINQLKEKFKAIFNTVKIEKISIIERYIQTIRNLKIIYGEKWNAYLKSSCYKELKKKICKSWKGRCPVTTEIYKEIEREPQLKKK